MKALLSCHCHFSAFLPNEAPASLVILASPAGFAFVPSQDREVRASVAVQHLVYFDVAEMFPSSLFPMHRTSTTTLATYTHSLPINITFAIMETPRWWMAPLLTLVLDIINAYWFDLRLGITDPPPHAGPLQRRFSREVQIVRNFITNLFLAWTGRDLSTST